MVSPIIGRGYGPNMAIVTRGYGGLLTVAAAAAARVLGKTRRKLEEYHEDLHEFTVKAMLLAVNGIDLIEPQVGTVKHSIVEKDTQVKAILKSINRLGYLAERIIINAFRVVRRGFKKIED